MRAFMSDTWPNGSAVAIGAAEWTGGNLVPALQTRALREAERILAEVEGPDVTAYPLDFNSDIPRPYHNTAFDSLIADLTAFVEE